jgi:4-hydroxy-tetrahydrodipicolinate synthase
MGMERVRTALRQVSGVHVTAYAADGGIDLSTTTRVVERIVAAGVANVVTCGNTGEFYSLTLDEAKRVAAAAVEAAAGRSVVTAGIGRSLTDAIDLARHAKAIGADAVMIHQPPDPFCSPRGVVGYVRAVADAVDLPIVAYIRIDAFGVAGFEALAAMPQVAGIKFATTNVQLLANAMRATQGAPMQWCCGLAEAWAPTFYAAGARGFTSGLVNVAPERSLAIHAALERGDFAAARAEVDAIAVFEHLRTLENNGTNVTVVKAAMEMMGVKVGMPRLPNAPDLPKDATATLAAALTSWGIGA